MGVVLGNALVVLAAIGFSGLLHNRFHQDQRVEMRMFSMPSSIVAESILFCRRLRRHVGQPLLRQRPPCRVILARRTIDLRTVPPQGSHDGGLFFDSQVRDVQIVVGRRRVVTILVV